MSLAAAMSACHWEPFSTGGRPGQRRRNVLLWAYRGEAHLVLADGSDCFVTAGTGIQLSALAVRSVTTAPGSVVIPIELEGNPATAARRFTVPARWQGWLLLAFAYQIAPITSLPGDHHRLLPRIGYPDTRRIGGHLAGPPMPSSGVAAEVAEQLLFDPSLDLSVDAWARQLLVGTSSLRRAFRDETGLTFQAWRAHCRLNAAAGMVAAGASPGEAALKVGYATSSGLTRAYRRYFGDPDVDLAWQQSVPRIPPHRSADTSQIGAVIDSLISGRIDPKLAAPLPSSLTRRVINDFSVLVWVWRGEAQVRVRRRWYRLSRGDAIWLPIGLECQTVVGQGSLILPVGAITRHSDPPRDPLRTHFDREQEAFLIYQSVARYTGLRPAGYDEQIATRFFNAQVHDQLASGVPLPAEPNARAAALAWIARLSDSTAGAPAAPEIADALLPMPRQSWANLVRMQVARRLLVAGVSVGAVARHLGYAEPQNFTRAFRRHHGSPPSEFGPSRRTSHLS